jgi:hypothetical protein
MFQHAAGPTLRAQCCLDDQLHEVRTKARHCSSWGHEASPKEVSEIFVPQKTPNNPNNPVDFLQMRRAYYKRHLFPLFWE